MDVQGGIQADLVAAQRQLVSLRDLFLGDGAMVEIADVISRFFSEDVFPGAAVHGDFLAFAVEDKNNEFEIILLGVRGTLGRI